MRFAAMYVTLTVCAMSCSFAALNSFSITTNGMDDITPLLEPRLERTRFPAFAAAVVRGTNIVAAGVAGARRMKEKQSVTLNDKFHIGSCTKSMTALLGVILEQEGKVKLTNRVADVAGSWNLPEAVREITLKQLLQNRSGIGNEPPSKLWARAFKATGKPEEQRKEFLCELLQEPLAAKPGNKYIYSNFGFALAGSALEEATGQGWENLIGKYIFEPLGLSSGGFGLPATDGDPDQPSGHMWDDDKATPAPDFDNPVAIAPAGAVHLSILDLARYAAFHLAAAQGKIDSLKSSREILYSPPSGGDYAFGWVVTKREWAGGEVLTHAGSNTMFFTVIWIAPAKDFAFVVSTNVGDRGDHVANQCDAVVGELIKRFLL